MGELLVYCWGGLNVLDLIGGWESMGPCTLIIYTFLHEESVMSLVKMQWRVLLRMYCMAWLKMQRR